ncbi:DUF305 domain-containing protein [Polaromonas sp.]|nr:DUF305 domain-containing protein [Candidatus Saccharibacteria bacterium]
MNKTPLVIVTTVAILAIAGGGFAYNQRQDTPPKTAASMPSTASHDAASLKLLTAQTGEAFDAMFITMMSEHHAGAIAMAQVVDAEAVHSEVRDLAGQIISAQNKELADMKAWAAEWNYTYYEPSGRAVSSMSAGMNGKSGEALDKQFLTDMVSHHNSALDMAMLSAGRAKHTEIKTLSANILSSQTNEITHMKQLASQFNYAMPSNASDGHSTMMH